MPFATDVRRFSFTPWILGRETGRSETGFAPPRKRGMTGRNPAVILWMIWCCSWTAGWTSPRPYRATLNLAPDWRWCPCAIRSSSEAPICLAQLSSVTLGEWTPTLRTEASRCDCSNNFLSSSTPWERGNGAENTGWAKLGPHCGIKKSGLKPGNNSEVLCNAWRTKFNHLIYLSQTLDFTELFQPT